VINALAQLLLYVSPAHRRCAADQGSAVAAALQECREAQRAFDQANAVLSPADRKLLKSVPADL
jgi:hypothetical protein